MKGDNYHSQIAGKVERRQDCTIFVASLPSDSKIQANRERRSADKTLLETATHPLQNP